MSKAKLRKALGELSKDELIEVVSELYDARKEAKDYLEYWMDPDSDKALEAAQTQIKKLFFSSSGKARKLPAAKSVNAVTKSFSTLGCGQDKVAELLLTVVENYSEWMKDNSKSGATTAARKAVENAANYIEKAGLETRYGLKLDRLAGEIDKRAEEIKSWVRRGWGWYF